MAVDTLKITPLRIFIILALLLIVLFGEFMITSPQTQKSLVFREGIDMLADFTNHVKYSCSYNVYTGDNLLQKTLDSRKDRVFPPLAYLFFGNFKPLLAISKTHIAMLWVAALWSMLIFSGLLILLLFMQISGTRWEKVLFTCSILFSGILLYAAERGNIVIFSAFLASFFLFYHQSSNPYFKELALLALALAAGLKIAPAILGVLLLMEKRWGETARMIAYGAVTVFLPFFAFPGGIDNLRFWSENVTACGKYFLTRGVHVGIGPLGEVLGTGNELLYYLLAGVACLAILISFAEKERWRKIFLLSLPMLFFPKESGYYNLLYLLPSLVLLCNSGDRRKIAFFHAVLFALAFTPLRFDGLNLLVPECFPPLLLWLLVLSVLTDSIYTLLGNKKEKGNTLYAR